MEPSLPPLLAAWSEQGRTLDVYGRRVFVRTAGDPDRPALLLLHGFPESSRSFQHNQALLLLHGFPTCSIDFRQALPRLAERFYVVTHDHVGFGLSEKPLDYSYSLLEQAELAVGVWQALGIVAGHVVAHDMGTSVAAELVARGQRTGLPLALSSVTFCNGSMRLDLASLTWPQKVLKDPTWGPLLARASSEAFFRRRLRKTFADPGCLSEAEVSAAWAGLIHGGGRDVMSAISSYLDERVRFLPRWWAALGALDRPCHVLWGDQDPVALPAIAEAVAAQVPGAQLTWLEGVGHYPMVEAPERWAEAVVGFVEGVG